MPVFEQKGDAIKAEDVEAVQVHYKSGTKTKYRLIKNKTFVKVYKWYTGSLTVRISYESSKRSWHNRTVEVHFDVYSTKKVSEEMAESMARDIVSEDDDFDWFDFGNKVYVMGLEDVQETEIDEDDLKVLEDLDARGEDYATENEKVIDSKGWGERVD